MNRLVIFPWRGFVLAKYSSTIHYWTKFIIRGLSWKFKLMEVITWPGLFKLIPYRNFTNRIAHKNITNI